MNRLTLNRRQKTICDFPAYIPAGDGLPVWSTLSLDAKLPMVSNPTGSVVLYTTKLGEPKFRSKQSYDFDLRDPLGKFVTNDYIPLHDPHLKAHFSSNMMRRHLIKNGFITEDGMILCSLKEFNQYRQYLRHTYFLKIAKERKEELEERHKRGQQKEADIRIKVSHSPVFRRGLQQIRQLENTMLKKTPTEKAVRDVGQTKEFRDQILRHQKQQAEQREDRRRAVLKQQQQYAQFSLSWVKKLRQRDLMRSQLIANRETQKMIRVELKCMERWQKLKEAQKLTLERNLTFLQQEEERKLKNIEKSEEMITKIRKRFNKKLENLKQKTRERKQKEDNIYSKRLEEKLASGDHRIWSKRKSTKRNRTPLCPRKHSSWKFDDILNSIKISEPELSKRDPSLMEMLNAAIDGAVAAVTGAVDAVTQTEEKEIDEQSQEKDEALQKQAHGIVQDVINKVKTEIYPQYLQMLEDETKQEIDGTRDPSLTAMLNAVIDGEVDAVSQTEEIEEDEQSQEKEEAFQKQAHAIVQDVINKVTTEIYPQYLRMLEDETKEETDGKTDEQSQEMEEALQKQAQAIVGDVINKVKTEIYHQYIQMLDDETKDETDGKTDDQSQEMEEALHKVAQAIVQDVINKVKTEIYPPYLQLLEDETKEEIDAVKSKSVRFSSDEEEIKASEVFSDESLNKARFPLKPVSEHILTPVASQLEIAKLEAEAILGSPEFENKVSSVSFVETLLLRLLDDLNHGRLDRDEIVKLASYCMDILQSEADTSKDVIPEAPEEETEAVGNFVSSSSSSVIAKMMVDFTLAKILADIQSGNVSFENMASFTVTMIDSIASDVSSQSISVSDGELNTFVDETIERAVKSAQYPREDSPLSELYLDNFVLSTLMSLTKDLENEALTKEQVHDLAESVKKETITIQLSDSVSGVQLSDSVSEIENQQDIHNVLQDVLRQLQEGTMDFMSIYQILFAIVFSYNTIRFPPTVCDERRFTHLLKDVLYTVEQKAIAGACNDVNLSIVQEASRRLSHVRLTPSQLGDLSLCVVSAFVKHKIANETMAKDVVENILKKVKDRLEHDISDSELRRGVMDIAEAVINTLPQTREIPTLAEVLLQLLYLFRIIAEEHGGIEDITPDDIDDLIRQIEGGLLWANDVEEIASTVVRMLKSPLQTESSHIATQAVHEALKTIVKDINNGEIEEEFLQDTMKALRSYLNAASQRQKTPDAVHSLTKFLKTVLHSLTMKLQIGELNESDFSELSNYLNDRIVTKEKLITKAMMEDNKERENIQETTDNKEPEKIRDTTGSAIIFNHIRKFIENVENGCFSDLEAEDVGRKLMECGRCLVGLVQEPSETFADCVVDEVIRNLQLELDSGQLTSGSLKEVAKVIVEATSGSDIAKEAVNQTLMGIYRDFERGYTPEQLPSIPSLTPSSHLTSSDSTITSQEVRRTLASISSEVVGIKIAPKPMTVLAPSLVSDQGQKPGQQYSPSASTIASNVVKETIQTISRDITERGISPKSVSSVVTAIVSDQGQIPLKSGLQHSPSASTIASHVVVETIDKINRDIIERETPPQMLSSIASLNVSDQGQIPLKSGLQHSSSALNMSSNVVMQTIDIINRDFSERGISPKMVSSVATSIVSLLSGDQRLADSLPRELEKFKPTLLEIVKCLREDRMKQSYAEDIFCTILENYKEWVLEEQEMNVDEMDQLSSDDVSLVNYLVTETIKNVERSVAKGKVNNDAFSIPSIPHTDDTSLLASDLINACVKNIRHERSAEQSLLEEQKHDLADFISEIVMTLQSELAKNQISNVSMAHFYRAITGSGEDLKTLEMNASTNLNKVVKDIQRNRGKSQYVHKILETYLMPNQCPDDVLGDPLKAVDSILVTISTDILTNFVKGTLHSVMIYIREDNNTTLKERAPSSFVLQSASLILVEEVVQEVISRIKQDFTHSKNKIHGVFYRKDFERAASQLWQESPNDDRRRNRCHSEPQLRPKKSLSSVLSKEIEDLVLETLHNTVSNLRLEQSIRSRQNLRPDSSDSISSSEIEDFILGILQNIVLEQQDKRSQIEMGVSRSENKFIGSSVELMSVESKCALNYVSETLQNVIVDLMRERSQQSNPDLWEADSINVQTLILESLHRGLTDASTTESAVNILNPDDVKLILSESIVGTIANIKAGKFSQENINIMYDTAKHFLAAAEPNNPLKGIENVTPDLLVEQMEKIKCHIKDTEIKGYTLDKISSQLATLGIDVDREVASVSSVESSWISSLVQDVLFRMINNLSDELGTVHPTNEKTSASQHNIVPPSQQQLPETFTTSIKPDESENQIKDTSSAIKEPESKVSEPKKDVNYNRKLSISPSLDSRISLGTVPSDISTSSKPENILSQVTNAIRSAKAGKSYSSNKIPEKKLQKRQTESRTVIRQSTTPLITYTTTRKLQTSPLKYKSIARPHQTTSARNQPTLSYTDKRISDKKTTKKPSKPPIEKRSFTRKSQLTSTPTSKPSHPERKCISETPNRVTKQKDEQAIPIDKPADEVAARDPLELRSLCGIHRTKISVREKTYDGDKNTDVTNN